MRPAWQILKSVGDTRSLHLSLPNQTNDEHAEVRIEVFDDRPRHRSCRVVEPSARPARLTQCDRGLRPLSNVVSTPLLTKDSFSDRTGQADDCVLKTPMLQLSRQAGTFAEAFLNFRTAKRLRLVEAVRHERNFIGVNRIVRRQLLPRTTKRHNATSNRVRCDGVTCFVPSGGIEICGWRQARAYQEQPDRGGDEITVGHSTTFTKRTRRTERMQGGQHATGPAGFLSACASSILAGA